jgi:MFS family permease
VFLVDDFTLFLLLYAIPAFFGGFYLAPTFALIQGLVGVRMRALASSITLFVINIIGLGFGPQLVGILSDSLSAAYGQESLRMSLLTLTFLNLWCALHYLLAARTLAADLEQVDALSDLRKPA